MSVLFPASETAAAVVAGGMTLVTNPSNELYWLGIDLDGTSILAGDAERLSMDTRSRTRAFTLIELMIVIAIIAILAAILIPNFLHARAEAVTAACEGNEKQLATAEEEYSVDNGGSYIALTSLTTPYLSVVVTDPVKKGNTYTATVASGSYGSYQITDQGNHDSTTTTSLTKEGAGTTACTACVSVVYDQNSGIHGK